MPLGLQVKYPLCLPDFNQTWIFLTDIWKFSLENPSIGTQVVCKQTDMRKLMVAFWNFVNMHKNHLRMLIDGIFSIGCKG